MLKSNTPSFGELRQYLDHIPVIDTHEHSAKHLDATDALSFVLGNSYYLADYMSAGGEASLPKDLSTKEKYEIFLKYYNKSDKTAYARGLQEGLRLCWGVENIASWEEFQAFEIKLQTREPSIYDMYMAKMGVKAVIANVFALEPYVEGDDKDYSSLCRFVFRLPYFHDVHRKEDLLRHQKYLNRTVTCLDDYLACFDNYFQKAVDFGIVAVKDQSAYRRSLAYGNPTRAEAESVFNDIVYNPRDVIGDDVCRPLDDWLFHYALRKAASYDLPVQLHTGHMAGNRNDIVKANASHLIPVLELHQDVRFDLFHGNWPYMDEYLFIGKNYPNVYLNLCWVQSIDPLYSIELMKRAVMTMPHSKIFAFGGDTGMIEWVVGYLVQARDNVACALAELVDSGWLSMDEAKQISMDWFFNNPNEFFRLGL